MNVTAHRSRLAALLAAVLSAAVLAAAPVASAAPAPASATGETRDRRLTNLSHLDWLGAALTPPRQAGHTTYRLEQDPTVRVLWTYAEPNADGSYRHVGGGRYDQATNTWSQGAFNADDISRASVAYLRDWAASGTRSSRDAAYAMLRGLTYLQTVEGPNAGNVVLWMQPDGTLNPSADPKELPDPSDSGASYWLARTIWALGEGYAAFRDRDPAFASFLRQRLDLAVAALDRQVLSKYGTYLNIDGIRVPAWLVVDGADASAEAALGLAAYVRAGGGSPARRALSQLAEGIAALQSGDARSWPFGAVLPWGLSRSVWHAWGSQMPAALARASVALGEPALAAAAARDSSTFDPWMLTSGGPDNGRLPTPTDRSQIAYGVDSRLESLLATAEVRGQRGPRRLAGLTAAWFFGANAAGVPAYDPATGRTVDGISGTGQVNRNAGAESTIHGVLAMLALDANPDVARIAKVASKPVRQGATTIEAETQTLTGDARTVTPASMWTGESLFGGTGYATLGNGGSVRVTVPPDERRLVLPVVNLSPGNTATADVASGAVVLGRVRAGDVGPQGDSPAPGALLPVTLSADLPAGATSFTLVARSGGADRVDVDAVVVQPVVSTYQLSDARNATLLLASASATLERRTVTLPGTGRATVERYDGQGRLVGSGFGGGRRLRVEVVPGGYTVVIRANGPDGGPVGEGAGPHRK